MTLKLISPLHGNKNLFADISLDKLISGAKESNSVIRSHGIIPESQ
ncbi:Uncharacterised protein [Vibrio cholerae]|nr:Uncharacterised protein [Vibrio cholerae]